MRGTVTITVEEFDNMRQESIKLKEELAKVKAQLHKDILSTEKLTVYWKYAPFAGWDDSYMYTTDKTVEAIVRANNNIKESYDIVRKEKFDLMVKVDKLMKRKLFQRIFNKEV